MRFNFSGVIGEVDTLPGCSQIAVSHSVFLPKNKRGSGLGKKAILERLQHLRCELLFDYVLCTVDAANMAQLTLLSHAGFTYLDEFESQKTGHKVKLYGKRLNG